MRLLFPTTLVIPCYAYCSLIPTMLLVPCYTCYSLLHILFPVTLVVPYCAYCSLLRLLFPILSILLPVAFTVLLTPTPFVPTTFVVPSYTWCFLLRLLFSSTLLVPYYPCSLTQILVIIPWMRVPWPRLLTSDSLTDLFSDVLTFPALNLLCERHECEQSHLYAIIVYVKVHVNKKKDAFFM